MKFSGKSVAIVGLGYVGLPLAVLAKEKGHKVFGIDYSKERVNEINKGHVPFFDNELGKRLKRNLVLASDNYEIASKAEVVVVCVPTPVDDDYMPDLTALISAADLLSKHLKKGQLVIIESTVNPGVCDEVVLPILEDNSGLKAGTDFFFAHCPERLSPGDKHWGVDNIARVVGGYDSRSAKKAKDFYASIISADIKIMSSLKEAEAVKVVENSFRDINIAFVNELAMSFSKLGIDVVNVIDGAATKPFAFMAHYPGIGVGGHCIPVDPYYLIEYAKTKGFHHEFLSAARKINKGMPEFSVQQLEDALNESDLKLKGQTVAILGLSYKAGIGDMRESPSFDVVKLLRKKGAQVIALDPFIEKDETDLEIRPSGNSDQIIKSLNGCTAIILATAHKEFLQLQLPKLAKIGVLAFVDGRNVYSKEGFNKVGIAYRGIGR